MKIFAFIKKDFQITISYRFRVLLQFSDIILSLFMFFFISKTFSGAISPYFKNYQGDYFSYALVGISISSFVAVGLNTLADEIRAAQVEGTLEALISTPTSIYTILIGNSVWSFLEAFIGSVILLTFGIFFLGISINYIQIIFTLLVLILTLITFLSVGMLSASFIMIFKQGNPIGTIFGTSSYFLGSVIFPVEVLPVPFQYVAKFLPITHAVRALRDILLANADVFDVYPLLINLLIFILLLLPVSVFFFRFAVKRAKLDGSLIQY